MEFFWYYCRTYTGVPNYFFIFFYFFIFSILEQRIISRFGSIVLEFFWYYCCTVTGMHFIIVNLFSLVLFSALSLCLSHPVFHSCHKYSYLSILCIWDFDKICFGFLYFRYDFFFLVFYSSLTMDITCLIS